MYVNGNCQGQISATLYFRKGKGEENKTVYHVIKLVGQDPKLLLKKNDASVLRFKREKLNKILCDLKISQTGVWIPTYQSVRLLVPDNWHLHQAISCFLQFA